MNDEELFVRCPECGHDQADMGCDVDCENCGAGPMPYHDELGNLVED